MLSGNKELQKIKEEYLADECGIDKTLLQAYFLGKRDGMSVKSEPKPCPFCGKDGESIVKKQHYTGWFSLYCENCRTSGPVRQTLPEASAAWNDREFHDA